MDEVLSKCYVCGASLPFYEMLEHRIDCVPCPYIFPQSMRCLAGPEGHEGDHNLGLNGPNGMTVKEGAWT